MDLLSQFNNIRRVFLEEKKLNLGKYIIGKNFDEITTRNNEIFCSYSGRLDLLLTDEIINESDPAVLKKIRFRFKEDYWTELVQTARRDIEELKNRVNHLLYLNNGTDFLQMAYEEVLFPTFLSGKKKYFGYAHMGTENFYPSRKNIFIKGIDIIKQGQTKVAKEIGMDIISSICSIENDKTPIEIVLSMIPNFYTVVDDIDKFAMTAKNKLPKTDKSTGKVAPGNVMVKTFVNRMKELSEFYESGGDKVKAADFAPPEVGDKFEYVVVKKATEWDVRGLKKTSNKGSKIEFLSVVKKYPDQYLLDIDYYMKNSFAAILGRFISYEEMFQCSAAVIESMKESGMDEDEILKYCDNYSAKAAKEWVIEQANNMVGVDIAAVKKYERARGAELRKKNKMAIAAGKSIIDSKIGGRLDGIYSLVNLTGKNAVGDYLIQMEWEQDKEKRRLRDIILAEIYAKREEIGLKLQNNAAEGISAIIDAYNIFDLKKVYEPKMCSRMSSYYQMQREILWKVICDKYGGKLVEIAAEIGEAISLASTAIAAGSNDIVTSAEDEKTAAIIDDFHNDFVRLISFEYLIYFYSHISEEIMKRSIKKGLSNMSLSGNNIKKLVSSILPETATPGGRVTFSGDIDL